VDANPTWPALSLAQRQATYATLHMWLQIVGKARLALAPMHNHCWRVTLYLTLERTALPVAAGDA
jgi:hypothetical protein